METDFQLTVKSYSELDQRFQVEVMSFASLQFSDKGLADPNSMRQLDLGQTPLFPKANQSIRDSKLLQFLFVPPSESPILQEGLEDFSMGFSSNSSHAV